MISKFLDWLWSRRNNGALSPSMMSRTQLLCYIGQLQAKIDALEGKQ